MADSNPLWHEVGVKQLRYMVTAALAACLILSTPFFSSVAALPVQEYDMAVPPKYQATYTALQNILNSFNSSLGPYPTSTAGLTFATELLPANGNRGPALFQSNNLASVTMNLNTLQTMGIQGVTIAIGYPLLDPSFPNSAQYLSYFQQVVSMAHAHGMKVLIESQILFANTPYSPLTYNWANLPYSQYVANHIAQDQLIINQIHPDFLKSESRRIRKLTSADTRNSRPPQGGPATLTSYSHRLTRGTQS